MTYLLDTDILSNLMKSRPSTVLIARLASVPPIEQATSSVNLGELVFGACRMPDRKDSLLERIKRLLLPNLAVLPFDEQAAWRYGDVRAELETQGTTVGEANLRIGSIALSRGLVVVTGNVRRFSKIPGLIVENWL